MCKIPLKFLRNVFPKHVQHCCYCFTTQLGVIAYSCIAVTVAMTSIMVNGALGPDLNKNKYSTQIIPFCLMLIYCVWIIVGSIVLTLGAFRLSRSKLLIGMLIVISAIIYWIVLCTSSFFPDSLGKYVCINDACADTQWLVDMRWRYRRGECPFRKIKPQNYAIFRREAFIDPPRTELWKETTTPDIIYNLVVNETFLNNGLNYGSNNVTNFKAWYPGCESRDPTLVFISILLAVAYLLFTMHLLWMGFGLRYQIAMEDYKLPVESTKRFTDIADTTDTLVN